MGDYDLAGNAFYCLLFHGISNQKVVGFNVNKNAAGNAKSQSGTAIKSTTDPSSSFSSLELTETC